MKKISIIVPCFNEEKALPLFYQKTKEILESMEADYELLLVDDGSKDATLTVMKKLAAEDCHVKYLSFSRNFGKEAAMYAGFCHADGDYTAVMDADLQDPPELLPQMFSILEEGKDGKYYDSVATRRVSRQGEPPIRSFFARSFYRIINRISDADVVDGARDFRMMKREMVEAIVSMGERNRFSKGIYGWIGFDTFWLPFENTKRVAGESKWSFWGLFRYALDGIINFSDLPLKLASWLGFFATGISLLALLFIVIRKLVFGDPVAGWASTVCVIIFIGGLQLFCLGIMGQYLARIYGEAKRRPHCIIEESNLENARRIL